jgi:hypothetical protein
MQNLMVHEDVTLEDVGFLGPVMGAVIGTAVQAGAAAYGAYTQRKIADMQGKHTERMDARRSALESKQIAIDKMLADATIEAGDAKRAHQKKINAIQLKIQGAQASLLEKKLQETEALNSIRAAERMVVATGKVTSTAAAVAAGTYTGNGDKDKILGMDKKTFTMVAIAGGVLLLGMMYLSIKK